MGPEAATFSPDVELPIEKETADSLYTALDTLNNQYKDPSVEKKALTNLKQILDFVLYNNSSEKFSIAASREIFLALKAQMHLEENFQPIIIAIDPQGRILQLSFQNSLYVPSEEDSSQPDPIKSQIPKIVIELDLNIKPKAHHITVFGEVLFAFRL